MARLSPTVARGRTSAGVGAQPITASASISSTYAGSIQRRGQNHAGGRTDLPEHRPVGAGDLVEVSEVADNDAGTDDVIDAATSLDESAPMMSKARRAWA
jgi:hypothetical protein